MSEADLSGEGGKSRVPCRGATAGGTGGAPRTAALGCDSRRDHTTPPRLVTAVSSGVGTPALVGLRENPWRLYSITTSLMCVPLQSAS